MGYPFTFGYCQVSDVESRINAGSWRPSTDATASPAVSQVNQFIVEASARIDFTLRKGGYYVPLVAAAGQTLNPVVNVLMLQICAALATAQVERVRHGGDQNDDPNSDRWQKVADDLLAQIADGASNLAQFGADGDYKPVANTALGMVGGGLADSAGTVSTPLFTRGQQF